MLIEPKGSPSVLQVRITPATFVLAEKELSRMTLRGRVGVPIALVLVAVTCSCSGTPTESPSAAGSSHLSSTTPASGPASLPATSPMGTANFPAVATLPREAGDLAVGPDGAVYAAVGGSPHREVIVRVDPATGSLVRSVPLPGSATRAGELAVSHGKVWVAGQDPRYARSSRFAFELDARTLSFESHLPMPGPPVAAAAIPGGVWVAAGRDVVLLDPSTGHVLRTAPVGGRVTRMAADPAGGRLYVATDTPSGRADATVFVELSAATGATLATAHGIGVAELGGPSGLAATSSGVWVSVPTGLQGGLQFLRSSDLHQASSIAHGSNGIQGSFAHGLLWFYTDPTGWLSCADPSTGRVRGHLVGPRHTLFTSDVVSAPSGVYVALTHEQAALGSQLVHVMPPLSCRTS
jgi:hypothetical protein